MTLSRLSGAFAPFFVAVVLSLNPLNSKAQQTASAANSANGLEEVVVTASKREERLQDVPSSLTAITGDALNNQGVIDFSDYMTLVPSLADFSGGSEGHGAVILRGLNTGYFQTSNTVGYYVDDIPFNAQSSLGFGTTLTLDPDLADIDHLEVLKGPQATLYGATALGGLIKVVTKSPDLSSYGGEVRIDGSTVDGGAGGYGLVGIANIPLITDKLAIRISGFDRDVPGYMTNVELGTKDRDVSRKQGGRIVVRWVPTENLDIKVSAFLQSLWVDGWNYEYVNQQTLAPLNGPYTYAAPYDTVFHTTYELYNATIKYTAGSIGTLTNSISDAIYNDHEFADYSMYYGFLNAFAPVPVPAGAVQPLVNGPSLKKFSDELRFASNRMGSFEWLAGLFFTREQENYPAYIINTIPPSMQQIPGPDGIVDGSTSPATYKEEAAFADLTYYFTDALDFTLGGRYSHNRQDVKATFAGFVTLGNIVNAGTSDTDFTYLASWSWRPTPGISTYARIATSYRPGGPTLSTTPGFNLFKPDSLTSYEVGLKSAWLHDTIRANLAVYYMDWEKLQMNFTQGTFDVTANGGKATSKGVELETQFAPVDRFTLGVNLAYTYAKLESVSAGVSAATGAVAGDSLPYTPKWSGSATADYVLPLSTGLTSMYGATYRYQGYKWSDYPGDPNNTGVVIPAYSIVDIHAGIAWSRYKLQARVANLFDSHGLDTIVQERIIPSNPPAWAAIIPPRTYVLSFVATF